MFTIVCAPYMPQNRGKRGGKGGMARGMCLVGIVTTGTPFVIYIYIFLVCNILSLSKSCRNERKRTSEIGKNYIL